MVRRIAMLFNAAAVRLVVCMLGGIPCTERSMMQRLARRWILALALGPLPQLLRDFARDAQRLGRVPCCSSSRPCRTGAGATPRRREMK